ncbi:lysophospholipid acyltransferase family protein [Blastochloris viridis]|uniref:2-acyl-glycerophospho-ethanolamine acyltransferase n=1 Tax=Blastochloris viridis TaxID=1079 RepID=A0A0P0J9C3_BLAVI|nr:lysophospholipid acyltransferase family protein [Blastochloris viridis]ALK08411.1 2-acyl-glycerophospho-ethanolamine acyltransferase [Blastochloris viridis]CUU41073.1 2-acyl-glycerophospho-ethanolamine acyltransferase [Blastochloris viridis]
MPRALSIPSLVLVTLLLLPLQWLAVTFRLSMRRLIPLIYHRAILRILGVRVFVSGEPASDGPVLVVSNHASWLDIPVLGSLFPLVFVAKQEIAGWPVFGLFAKLQRSVFVDRSRRLKTGEVNAEIAARMVEGEPVVLFGEGTSSDGNRVLPFRSALVGAAHDVLGSAAGGSVSLQPVSIAYTRLDGLPMGRFLRPHVAWYGDMDMPPHLAGVLKRSSIDVVVSFGPVLKFDGAANRKETTRRLEAAVRAMTAAALAGRDLPHTAAVPFLPETR